VSAIEAASAAVGGVRPTHLASAGEPIAYSEPFQSRSKIIMLSKGATRGS
jgi:hypothetical protein